MYEERKESFSVRSLILQILFVVLTVFLLLWLFPTKNYVKDYANDAFTEKLQPLYNQIYSQNITTMKEAAISYFTTDRLPSKVGESVTITLKEMQDKKLVLDLIDSNNKKCDVEKSSVKVEKLDNEYLMTVKLECSDASNYIEVHLGCYDYCKASGVCEKKETPVIKPTNPTKPVISEKKYQYEYEKITDGKWGDFGEWSQWSKDTITKTEYRNVETKEVTKKTGTLVDVIDAKKDVKTTYSCPSGYTLNGTKTKCVKKVTDVKKAVVSTKYTCTENGYTLNGTKCVKKVTDVKNAVVNTKYTCTENGYTPSGTKCVKKVTDVKKAVASTTYGDWVYQGKYTFNSIQYTSDTRKVVRVSSSINTNCTTNCTTNTWTYLVYNRSKKTTYSCADKTYNLNAKTAKCTKELTYTKNAVASKSYSCADKTYNLNAKTAKCTKELTYTKNVSKTDTVKYSCTDKDYKLNGNKCTKTVDTYTKYTYYRYQERKFISGTRDIKWSTSKTDSTLLKQGYVLTGNKKEIK